MQPLVMRFDINRGIGDPISISINNIKHRLTVTYICMEHVFSPRLLNIRIICLLYPSLGCEPPPHNPMCRYPIDKHWPKRVGTMRNSIGAPHSATSSNRLDSNIIHIIIVSHCKSAQSILEHSSGLTLEYETLLVRETPILSKHDRPIVALIYRQIIPPFLMCQQLDVISVSVTVWYVCGVRGCEKRVCVCMCCLGRLRNNLLASQIFELCRCPSGQCLSVHKCFMFYVYICVTKGWWSSFYSKMWSY